MRRAVGDEAFLDALCGAIERTKADFAFVNPDPELESTWIHVLRSDYYFTNNLFVSIFVQTNSAVDKLNVQAVGVWRFKPPFGSVQIAFQREQVAMIRRHSPGRTVTHNLMGLFSQIDYHKFAADLDVVSWDNYPFFWTHGRSKPPPALAHALMRGLKRQPVWVMEQASGAGGWGMAQAQGAPRATIRPSGSVIWPANSSGWRF